MSKDARIAEYKLWHEYYVNPHPADQRLSELDGVWLPRVAKQNYLWRRKRAFKVARQNFLWRKRYVERRNNS